MSAGRKRLEDALQAGKDIESDESPPIRDLSVPKVTAIKDLDFGDIMGVFSVHLSPRDQYLAAGCGNGAVQVYSCDTGKKRRPLKHGSLYGLPVTTVKFFPFKDDRLMSTTSDGTITCWDLDNWSHMKSVDEPHNEISTLDFSHDGKIFATAGKDRKVRVYDSDTMQVKLTFAGSEATEPARSFRAFLSPVVILSLCASKDKLANSDLVSSKCLKSHGGLCWRLPLRLNIELDRKVRVYDSDTMQVKLTFAGSEATEPARDVSMIVPEGGHGKKVFGLRFHPFDDNVFLTGGWDRCLKIWDVRVDHVIRSIHGPYICGDGIDICQDEVMTASWLHQKALQIWDYGSGELIENVPFPCGEHGEFLYVGRFVNSQVVVAGGSGTKDVKILTRKPHKWYMTINDLIGFSKKAGKYVINIL
ncbi:predicted protein [Nematostella vectensis]|uniref:Uncharacterized protein n=1 Tax=Nematostella vectensis TaxID=45351 RepID=A7T527_NEMVE|nr:predicted protein [Nematostella vectensis]|eukprot:XP_001621037.1 hypothetical protein NEMVEDRAFT_v1g248723 [Nematostella vectensis]